MPIKLKNIKTRAELEKKQSQIITIGFLITGTIILALVGYAIIYETLLKYRTPVAEVGNQKINGEEFIQQVRLRRKYYVDAFTNLYNIAQQFASDESLYQYATNQMYSYQQTIEDPKQFGRSVLDELVNQYIIAMQAEEFGISVSESEIDSFLENQFGFFPSGTPTPIATLRIFPTPTYSATQYALLNITPLPSFEPIATEIISFTETTSPTPEMNVNEQNNNSPTPTATPYTRESYEQTLTAYFDNFEKEKINKNSIRESIYYYLLQLKLQSYYNEHPVLGEQVWARHILVKTEADAALVINRLNFGEDWAQIAAEVSQDSSNKDYGGDLGWFPRGRMVSAFENAAFDLKVGEISQPIQTEFGWHVIQVLGHDSIPMPFEDWFNEIMKSQTININDNWEKLVPSEPAIPIELKLYPQQ